MINRSSAIWELSKSLVPINHEYVLEVVRFPVFYNSFKLFMNKKQLCLSKKLSTLDTMQLNLLTAKSLRRSMLSEEYTYVFCWLA